MSDEDGFTLIELLMGLVIGLIVVLAAFQALERFSVAHATVALRTDNTQRGRFVMDQIIRELRSEVCTGPGGPSLLAGTPTSITFVTDLGDGTVPPEKRTLTYTAATRRLNETRYAGTTLPGGLPFSTTAAYGPVLSNVEPDGATPMFGYWGYDTASPPRPTLALPTPLSDADRARVARITVAFRVGPAVGVRNRGTGASLQDEIILRSVDPADPIPLPLCS